METLAYIHFATTSQSSEDLELSVNPFDLRWFEALHWKKLPSSAWISLGAIAISLALLGIASSSALALNRGNRGTQVIALQQKLKDAGHFNPKVTGFYGPQTQAAVRSFQQARGLAVDGIAGSKTLSVLYGSSGGGTSGSGSTVPTTSSLKRGTRGTAVTQLQNTLKAKGFFKGPVTGYYGSITEEAVRQFQRSRGLPIDGIAGSSTLVALNGTNTVPGGNISTGIQLQPGTSGPAVAQLQNRLKALRFYNFEITSYYDRLTEAAVRDFQRSRGITVNGIAGPTTLAALESITPGNPNTAILRRGSQGIAVSGLQNRLKALGFFNRSATGYYGEVTEAAVRNFQRSRGISVNGIAGPTTMAALQGIPPSRNTTAMAGTVPAQPIASLQRGSRSTRVQSLQARLTELGYYKGSLDGVFGLSTEAALKRYQQDVGLVANGIAEAKTFASFATQANNYRERTQGLISSVF